MRVLLYGNISSRSIASDVLCEKLHGGDEVDVMRYKNRIRELQAKVAQLQQQRDEQVPDPKRYISYDELKGAHGLYLMADFIPCAADRLVELEAQPESQEATGCKECAATKYNAEQ
jgi:hypothetical protein